MTRENKAGLVVSAAFVALVGTVVTLKMRAPQAATGSADSASPALSMGPSPCATGKAPPPDTLKKPADKKPKAPQPQVARQGPGQGSEGNSNSSSKIPPQPAAERTQGRSTTCAG